MNDVNWLELFLQDAPEEVRQAHELVESEDEPYVEDYDVTNSLIGRTFTSPFARERSWFTAC